MRPSYTLATCLLAIPALASAAFAQNEVMYKGNVAFTSRGNIGTGTGEVLQGFHSDYWRACGQASTGDTGLITALSGQAFQDQDQTTAETYRWVIRSGTDANGPTTGTAGEIFVSGDQTLGPGTGTGAAAWNVTTTLTTPVAVPSSAFFAVGVQLTAASWTADGMSVWAASQETNNSTTLALDMAWQIIGTATTAIHPSLKRTWRMGFNQAPAALQLGNFTGTGAALYGSGGNFPNRGVDGVAFRVNGTGFDGDIAAVFLAGGFGTSVDVFGGRLALDVTSTLPIPVAVGAVASGVYENKNIALWPATLGGHFTFQAVLINGTAMTASMTNAVKVTF
ncbi:MAG: hypothetical protein KDC95_23200 [Planctomycetes bacterium]|nr:hypothetical protein [Planctomycetota bacterium]